MQVVEENTFGSETYKSNDAHGPAKPRWFTPIAVSAIVLGSLFGCCGTVAVGGQIVTRSNPNAFQASSADPAMKDLMQRNAELQAKMFPVTATAGALGIVHSLVLLVAGIFAYRRTEFGRKFLLMVCVVGIGIELITGSIGLWSAKQTSAYTSDVMKTTFAAQQAKSPAATEEMQESIDRVASGTSAVASLMGVMFAVLWFVLKAAYFVFCSLYLKRDDVVQYATARA